MLVVSELKFTRNLLTDLCRPDLVELCKQGPGPVEEPVREFLRQTFRQKTLAEWQDWFAGRDIAFSPVKNLVEAIHDPHVHHRRMVVTDDRGLKHLGIPIKFRDEPGGINFACPELGQHGPEILRDLGYSAEDGGLSLSVEAPDLPALQRVEAELRAAGLSVSAGVATTDRGSAGVQYRITGAGA